LRPVNPFTKRKTLARIHDPGSSYNLSLRYFSMEKDMRCACDWFEKKFPVEFPIENKIDRCYDLQEIIIKNLRSDQEQVFCCLLDKKPLFQVDICEARHDNNLAPFAQGGDFRLALLTSLEMAGSEDLFRCALKFCIDYFFSFKKIKAVFIISGSMLHTGDWLIHAGFEKIKSPGIKIQEDEIYKCTKH